MCNLIQSNTFIIYSIIPYFLLELYIFFHMFICAIIFCLIQHSCTTDEFLSVFINIIFDFQTNKRFENFLCRISVLVNLQQLNDFSAQATVPKINLQCTQGSSSIELLILILRYFLRRSAISKCVINTSPTIWYGFNSFQQVYFSSPLSFAITSCYILINPSCFIYIYMFNGTLLFSIIIIEKGSST